MKIFVYIPGHASQNQKPYLCEQVHADGILKEPRLRKRAAVLERSLRGTWARMDGLFQSTRSMLAFLGNLPG